MEQSSVNWTAVIAAAAGVVQAVYRMLEYHRGKGMDSQSSSRRKRFYIWPLLWALVAWAAVGFDYWDRHHVGLVQLPPLVTHYGNLSMQGVSGCQGGINTGWLINCREKYAVALACGIQDSLRDPLNDTRMSISAPFTITGKVIEIVVPYRQEMLGILSTKGENDLTSLWFYPLLIPKDVDVTAIHRLSDVPKYGGKVVDDEFFSRLVNHTGCD